MQRMTDPAAIYAALAALQVGDSVPEAVYILDEKDGTIPDWVLIDRRETGASEQLALIFEDRTPRQDQPKLWDEGNDLLPRRGVLTWRERTLATAVYCCETLEWQAPDQRLCDLGQQARYLGPKGKLRKAVA